MGLADFGSASSIGSDLWSGVATGVRNFNGMIDEVAIWNTTLSDQQIAALYTNSVSGVGGIQPSILVQPADIAGVTFYGNMGIRTNLIVTAIGNDLTYQWYKNGVPLSDTTDHYGGTTSASLWFTNAQASDSATNYTVVVSNPYGSVNQQVHHALRERPGDSAPMVGHQHHHPRCAY